MRSAFALLAALGLLFASCGPPAEPRARLAIGDEVGTLRLEDVHGQPVHVETDDGTARATVVWFWSTTCGCVRECESRIRALLDDYEAADLRFLAVDASDVDDREAIETLRRKLGSPYVVHRDVHAREAIRLGIEASASVAVIDAEGRLRYRGAIDDDLRDPQVSYVRRAVDAILHGGPIEPKEVESYGCAYPVPGT